MDRDTNRQKKKKKKALFCLNAENYLNVKKYEHVLEI
jgi:uncharacterized protein YjbK